MALLSGLSVRILVFIAATIAFVASAAAEKRVALVIGNGAYEHVSKLPNPTNDAVDVAAALRRLNFDVTHLSDLDRNSFIDSISDFSEKADDADMAIFFFAGHGMEIARQNYLVPTDASMRTDKKVRYEAISLEDVSIAMEGVKGLKLILLDACRNNPFVKEMKMTSATRSIGRGLAAPEPSVGSLVSFAAKEGTVASDGVGRNSPYTAGLLANLEEPGLEVNFLFRKIRDSVIEATGGQQEPFTYGSLPGTSIYLKPPVKVAALETGTLSDVKPVVMNPIYDQVENSYWVSIVNLNNKELFQSYLDRYPNGQFAVIANYRIKMLDGEVAEIRSKITNDKAASASQLPTSSYLTIDPNAAEPEEEEIEDLVYKVQATLNKLGCSVGRADGKWGRGSVRGLKNFARFADYRLASTKPTPELYRYLLSKERRICPEVKRQARSSNRSRSSGSSANRDAAAAIVGAAIAGRLMRKF